MSTTKRRLRVGLIGFGAIGREFLARVGGATSGVEVVAVVLRPGAPTSVLALLEQLAPQASAVTTLANHYAQLDLVVEAAGHGAIEEHVMPALLHGVNAVLASVGALAPLGVAEKLEEAASRGGAQVQLIAGAIGAIDALTAAKQGGLAQVRYTGRKAPLAWRGTAAEALVDLSQLTREHVFFSGSAREAAQRFPKNANVAATVALAGIGLDRTLVQLIADPTVKVNVHQIFAQGEFGELELTMRNLPLVTNPKTSALTVYSLIDVVAKKAQALVI
jgi:aspartate dehydrogenase